MSRYLLGLRPRFDLAPDTFEFCLAPGSLAAARGRLPHPAGGWIDIEWRAKNGRIEYSCRADNRLVIHQRPERAREIAAGQEATWQVG
jgi:hypothetical protein